MAELFLPQSEEEPLGSIPSSIFNTILYSEKQRVTDPFMSYITDCAVLLQKQPELQVSVLDIHAANERLKRIVDRFHIPTDATYLPPQYQFQIATLSLALAHLIPSDEEDNFKNPHVQAIEKLLRSAAQHESITEDIDHLVVAITVIDGLPKSLRERFQKARQRFVDLYKQTRSNPDAHHDALEEADDWLEMIRDTYAKDNVLRLTFRDREEYNTAYEKIGKDLEFSEIEDNANYASGMGLTSVNLAILCIEELMNRELEAHEKEHLKRNLSLFGLFGDALEEGLVELESLRKDRELKSPQDLLLTEENFDIKIYYLREMRLLQSIHLHDPSVYELIDIMSSTESTPTQALEDAHNFAIRCIERFGLEGLALLYLSGIVPLDENKEKEDHSLFVGGDFGKIPTQEAQERLEKLFAHYSSNLLVM